MQTLNNFFNTDKESQEWVAGVRNSQEYARARQLIAKELGSIKVPPSFYELLITRLCDALNIQIAEILIGGWRKQREIAAYRDKENPPSGFHKVPLVDHTLTSSHSPVFKPVINGITYENIKIKFDIVLKLKIEGVILMIRDGKIMGVSAGTCSGSGSIGHGGFAIIEKKSTSYPLGKVFPFEEGIRI